MCSLGSISFGAQHSLGVVSVRPWSMSGCRVGVIIGGPLRHGCGPKLIILRVPQVNIYCILTSCSVGMISFDPQHSLGVVSVRPWSMSGSRHGRCRHRTTSQAWLRAETYHTEGAPGQYALVIVASSRLAGTAGPFMPSRPPLPKGLAKFSHFPFIDLLIDYFMYYNMKTFLRIAPHLKLVYPSWDHRHAVLP